jgi:LuxR family transcriptional regulator, maltose regulon positive regulatory protein
MGERAAAEAATSERDVLLNPIPARRARLLLTQGDLGGAARWTSEAGLGADDEPDRGRDPRTRAQPDPLTRSDAAAAR